MSFKLGERIRSDMNLYRDDADSAHGTVVAVWNEDEGVVWLNEEVQKHEDAEYYEDDTFMDSKEDVIVLFDDGHMEWGYFGDGDFSSLEG